MGQLNPNALFTPTFMLETAFLYLLILVAMSFVETTSIRLVGYSLVVAIPFGDFFWDAMQLANMPLNNTLILDLVCVACIPDFYCFVNCYGEFASRLSC